MWAHRNVIRVEECLSRRWGCGSSQQSRRWVLHEVVEAGERRTVGMDKWLPEEARNERKSKSVGQR